MQRFTRKVQKFNMPNVHCRLRSNESLKSVFGISVNVAESNFRINDLEMLLKLKDGEIESLKYEQKDIAGEDIVKIQLGEQAFAIEPKSEAVEDVGFRFHYSHIFRGKEPLLFEIGFSVPNFS